MFKFVNRIANAVSEGAKAGYAATAKEASKGAHVTSHAAGHAYDKAAAEGFKASGDGFSWIERKAHAAAQWSYRREAEHRARLEVRDQAYAEFLKMMEEDDNK